MQKIKHCDLRAQKKKKKKKMKITEYREGDPEEEPEQEEAEAAKPAATEYHVVAGLKDPLEFFGMDIMLGILSHLDPRSGILSLLVCHAWNGVASSDRLWSPKCEELFLGKAHMPRLLQLRGLSRLAAYSMSIEDGQRSRILRDDLCDHVWEFHFNKAAPDYWRNLDPYWNGTGSLMRRYFHPDGSLTADHGDEVWGGHESCYCTVTGILENGKIRAHYVRINRWPRMFVSRKQDWSWELSNNIFCYTSIPDSDTAGGTGPLLPVR